MRFPTLALLLSLCAAPAAAQVAETTAPPPARISTGVVPDTVTVGEPFTAVVRVAAHSAVRVTMQLAADSAAPVQPLSPATISTDSAGTTYVQRMVAWRTGVLAAPVLVVRVAPEAATNSSTAPAAVQYHVALRIPFVRSVLPADTTALEPKPARPPLGAPDFTGRLVAIGALLLLAALAAWARARRGRAEAAPAPRDPREEALALLAEARAGGFVEAARWVPFYSLVSEALRIALAARSAVWARDLTTRELAATSTPEAPLPTALLELLERADRVKFAAAGATPAEAAADLETVEAWVRAEMDEPAVGAAGEAR